MLNNAPVMERFPPPAQPVVGVPSGSAAQIAYVAPYQQPPMAAPPSSFSPSSSQLTFQQAHQFHLQQQQQQNQQLQTFWAERTLEIEQTTDFKNHTLPLARIKKIMKADEDVRMISAEAPVVFAKACEIFILELTLRSWLHTEENKRRTLQKNDIAAAISRTDIFDFLVDIVPRDELKEEGLGIPRASLPVVGGPADPVPYYYLPQPNQAGAHDVYSTQQSQPGPFMPWPQVQPSQQQMPDIG